jgi:putative ATP-dependent endonuclease of the OLD family
MVRFMHIDLDRLNISILPVDGIGFKPYISLLASLNIDWVVRTDNDVFKIPKKDEHRFSGIKRGISLYRDYYENNDVLEKLLDDKEDRLSGFVLPVPEENLVVAKEFINVLEEFDIFLANKDLENDLLDALGDVLRKYLRKSEDYNDPQKLDHRLR